MSQIEHELQHQISHAIDASENIIACLHTGDFEGAKKYDSERASFIRTLSKCRNIDAAMPLLADDLQTLAQLNESIIVLSRFLRDEVLTDIRTIHLNRASHGEYIENQNIPVDK